jgi:hypothetical protein
LACIRLREGEQDFRVANSKAALTLPMGMADHCLLEGHGPTIHILANAAS